MAKPSRLRFRTHHRPGLVDGLHYLARVIRIRSRKALCESTHRGCSHLGTCWSSGAAVRREGSTARKWAREVRGSLELGATANSLDKDSTPGAEGEVEVSDPWGS